VRALQAIHSVVVGYRTNRTAAEALSAETLAVNLPEDFDPGEVDLIVHAVGPEVPQRWISGTTGAEWEEAMGEVRALEATLRCGLPALRRSRGALVVLSSAGVRRHPAQDVLSTAPKAAMEAMVRAVAKEEARFGVRANSVGVGVIDAGMFRRIDFPEGWQERALASIPLARFGRAEEVGQAVAYLANAPYVTGHCLVVDGGWSL